MEAVVYGKRKSGEHEPVLNGFGHMRRSDSFDAGEIGNRAADPQNPIAST